MWFDSRPSYWSPPIAPAPLGFTFPTQGNAAPPPALDCFCFVRTLLIKTPSAAHAKQLVDLVSAFGDSIPLVNQESSIRVEFFDCRDCYKALTLMPKFSECKDCDILPLDDKLYGVYYRTDSTVSKEELWYEVSKHGDIAWSKSEQHTGATNIYYAFFDKRSVAKLLETAIYLSGRHLRATQNTLDHADICRFQAKTSATESLQASSPSLSSVSLSSVSSLEYTYSPYDMAKPKIASPPLSVAQLHTTNEDKAPAPPRAMKIPGHLTPPMQDCRMFQAAINKPPCVATAPAPAPAPPAAAATVPPAGPPAGAPAPASAHASTAAAATAAGPSPASNAAKSNRVDLDLIKFGREKRTTVMLRNIPNKVNLGALRAFLDETNENEYDFLYLRMDFNNKCNVGYAFINFTRPESVATLTQARRGKKWTQYNSVKIIDVSFANIQGRKALIDKFRDSPIMNMDPEYRPKLYYTSGPLAGREERFA